MFYITVKQSPMYHQMTLEELFSTSYVSTGAFNQNTTNTRTYELPYVSEKFRSKVNVYGLIQVLHNFNEQTKELHDVPRHNLYREFYIPKKSGGLRKIDAPQPVLMDALRRLKTIFDENFKALYHTSAFAYISGRSTIECMKRHQQNESKWYGKYDLHNFFGSTTPEFVFKMFSMIFPFSEVMKDEDGKRELETALDLAFLDGGLPQGTPISPTITNIMMIPVDYKLAQTFREFNHQRFVYTRYADDFQISSKYTFSFREVEQVIAKTLEEFGAPFTINAQKTRYGSVNGSNWNLGIVINKDNNMTVGYKAKRQFQAMLSSYIMDKQKGVEWDRHDVQVMEGHRNYYRMVEGETIDNIVAHINQKFGVDVVHMMKDDLRAG